MHTTHGDLKNADCVCGEQGIESRSFDFKGAFFAAEAELAV